MKQSARHTSKSRIKMKRSRALPRKLRKETHLSSLRRNIIAGHPECSKTRLIGFIRNGTTNPWDLSLTAAWEAVARLSNCDWWQLSFKWRPSETRFIFQHIGHFWTKKAFSKLARLILIKRQQKGSLCSSYGGRGRSRPLE